MIITQLEWTDWQDIKPRIIGGEELYLLYSTEAPDLGKIVNIFNLKSVVAGRIPEHVIEHIISTNDFALIEVEYD